MYDILIKNARIADGTGNPMYHADVAVEDGKIVRIGYHLRVVARRIIDGTGKVLAPGFIDAHSHLDTGIEAAHHRRPYGTFSSQGYQRPDELEQDGGHHFHDGKGR